MMEVVTCTMDKFVRENENERIDDDMFLKP